MFRAVRVLVFLQCRQCHLLLDDEIVRKHTLIAGFLLTVVMHCLLLLCWNRPSTRVLEPEVKVLLEAIDNGGSKGILDLDYFCIAWVNRDSGKFVDSERMQIENDLKFRLVKLVKAWMLENSNRSTRCFEAQDIKPGN